MKNQGSRLQAALSLKASPVAIALVDELPAGVALTTEPAPAGCSFWERAEAGVFATEGKDHELCSVGVYTHNLSGVSERHASELGAVLKVMNDLDYLSDADLARVPHVERSSRFAIYGPVDQMPIPADVVLLFADGRQSLVVAEAVGQVEAQDAPAIGRPACALVPQVVTTGHAAQSLGCCGARAYLDGFSDELSMWGLPGGRLDAYLVRVEALAAANDTLAAFHAQRRLDVEAGGAPSYAESMGRLSS